MKRRGFLGFLGGAAVAGPGMIKQAAADTLTDLQIPGLLQSGIGGLNSGFGGGDPMAASSQRSWAVTNLAKLISRTAAQHEYHKNRTQVYVIDPDLASYRSMSLSAKVALQKERNYARELVSERGYLEATIAGWFGD